MKNNTPIAIGYNGTKPGRCNCCEDENGNTLPSVRHAEINALNKLWNSETTAKGAWMFATDSPCLDCVEDLHNAGVTHIFYSREYRLHEGILKAIELGIKIYFVDPEDQTICQKAVIDDTLVNLFCRQDFII